MVIINLITLTSVYLHCWYHKTIKILVNISDDWMRNSRCLVRILFKTRNADVHVEGMDFYQFNFFPSLYLHIAHFALQKFHVARTTWSVEKPLVTNFVNRTSVWSCGFFIRQLHMKPARALFPDSDIRHIIIHDVVNKITLLQFLYWSKAVNHGN